MDIKEYNSTLENIISQARALETAKQQAIAKRALAERDLRKGYIAPAISKPSQKDGGKELR